MQVFTSAMKNAPQITNTWGCITSIIDYIFQDFVPMDFTKIETYDKGVVKITFDGVNNPIVLGQKIVITETTNYNKTYIVTDIDITNTIATLCNKSIVKGTATETGAFKMKVDLCPLTKSYGSAAEQKLMIKFKNGWNLRIDDRPIGNLLTPNVTWNDTWAKFARIALAENSTGIDNLSGVQIPYNSSYPTLNINPVNEYVGNSIFIYNSNAFNISALNTSNLNSGTNFYNVKWFIYCDDNFFFMFITSRAANNSGMYGYRVFYASECDSFYSNNGKGMMLSACSNTGITPTINDLKWNSTTWAGNTDTHNPFFRTYLSVSQQYNSFYYDDSLQSYITYTTSPLFNINNISASSGSSNTSNQIVVSRNVIILSKALISNRATTPRAIAKHFRWICTYYNPMIDVNGLIFEHENDKYIQFMFYNATTTIDSTSHIRGLVKLEIPN